MCIRDSNITVAAKEGGDPNPDNNASLAAAIEKAKGYSLPKDKIKTAIDKAFGSGKDAANYETVVYEGYGPCGVAIYCEALTDNRNRTAADVRAAFTHAGGNLGTSGSVSYMFERKGQIMVPKEVETGDKKHPMGPNGAAADEEEFEMAVIEAGGDDYEDADEEWIVYTQPSDLMAVKKALEEQGVQVKGAEMTMEATTPATVTANDAKKVMRLVDRLEELEDLQNVYHTWTSPRKSPRLWKKSKQRENFADRKRLSRCEGRFFVGGVLLAARRAWLGAFARAQKCSGRFCGSAKPAS